MCNSIYNSVHIFYGLKLLLYKYYLFAFRLIVPLFAFFPHEDDSLLLRSLARILST